MTTTIATVTTGTTPPRKLPPIKMALGYAIGELSQLYFSEHGCPDYPVVPEPDDHLAVAEFLHKVALIHGRLLRAVGLQVKANALCHVEMARFADDTFLEAIDGWATGECERAARAAGDDLEDRGADAGDRRVEAGRV
jgi:hypothetical protein